MTAKSNTEKKTEKKVVRKSKSRHFPIGIVHVQATFNNTIVTVTDMAGHVVAWASAGKSGFKHSKKSSAYAGNIAAQNATKDAMALGMKEVKLKLTGPGAGRESAVRGVQSTGMIITEIEDVTPVAHNGCRPRKRRRC
ncbi:MAG: 30S ribosomal protein S11 [Chlamydiae bacterium]|nr:30S ribosomal protein S11 [Chlamydiota bacterium]